LFLDEAKNADNLYGSGLALLRKRASAKKYF